VRFKGERESVVAIKVGLLGVRRQTVNDPAIHSVALPMT